MTAQHQAELEKKLWAIANTLRANSGIEASEFKNYILGIIFLKFLSENTEDYVQEALKNDGVTYEQAWANEELREAVKADLLESKGYFIEPEFLFSNLIKEIDKGSNGKFDIELLQEVINQISRSTHGQESEESFDHLFDDMDLNSSKLGKTVKERSAFMAKILTHVNSISFRHDDVEIDVLGNAYEYLISNFAASAGKKAGEFYTPQQVSKILAKVVANGKTHIKSVYDPTCGSGSLLLRVAKESEIGNYYGQELISTTYNLARMNMMLHGVPYQRFDIRNGNTLVEPLHEGEKFEAIVANPPYSANWEHTEALKQDDRFSGYGKMAPPSFADFAFVQHMIHHLDENGTMAVVLPHGVLFRGGAEGVIRKKLIDDNYLDAVIGLPANIFYGTSIPTAILVFKKNRNVSDDILFIDSSNDFKKGKNQNILTDENVTKIVATYIERRVTDKYSASVSRETITNNEYNSNIPRYVDSSIEESPINLNEISESLEEVNSKINSLEMMISTIFAELKGVTDGKE